jgi:hypothetical protein
MSRSYASSEFRQASIRHLICDDEDEIVASVSAVQKLEARTYWSGLD